ncbi:MAG: class I SAM-dependent methyltransferase [Nanoarchaeota archaeon]|nr:class I SAM-dependent methyltransferase [Nanoarchaeota archaeon]
MVRLSRHEHYFVKKPKSKKKEYKFQANINGIPLTFITASGIFSPRKIDLGTLTLITYMQFRRGDKILDLGCGYGAIGIAAAKMCPSCKVTLVDINERAVECAKKNIKINNVSNATAKQSFFFSALKNEKFNVILLNPPQTAGLEVCYKLIEGAYEHLKEGGSLQMVVRKRHGGQRLADKMEEIFGNIEVLGKKGGYWVYKSVKE